MIVYICNVVKEVLKYINNNYSVIKQNQLFGRYITLKDIEFLVKKLPPIFKVNKLGSSFKNKPIYKIRAGNGKKRILFWSQMHGNESTGTKAMFDLFQFIENPLHLITFRDKILKNCTLVFIPMLNPDGALEYTRLNAQKIDLNRDAVDLKAPESKLLNKILFEFKPHFCFNLHDQRTIFSVGKDNNPATLSFLAPSIDVERTITESRKKTMQIIANQFKDLSLFLPNQIGRYTDKFYPTATGDNFQKAGFNTILIEAGHFKDDYQREITRKFNFIALLSGIFHIDNKLITNFEDYFKIPNNNKKYTDLIYTNIIINKKQIAFNIYFESKLINKKLVLIPKIKQINLSLKYNANKIIYKAFRFNSVAEFKQYINNLPIFKTNN